MTKNEVLKVLSIVKVAYPNSFRDTTKADAEATIELWSRQFKDYEYQTVMMALDSIISTDTSDFMPSIGKIKEMIVKLNEPSEMTEQEAWGLVFKALRNSWYNSQKEFDKLPTVIQRIVGSHNQLKEWAMMPTDQVNSVVASNFMRSYRARAKNEREMLKIPTDVKNALACMEIKRIQ